MKLKDLFAAPTEKKVSEKNLYRVLISSICSILLCISCLAGTTWAWFAVSIDNTENVIQIGTPAVDLAVDNVEFVSGTELPGGEHTIKVSHANDTDFFDQKCTLYVTFSIDNAVIGYVTLDHENGYTANIKTATDKNSIVSWVVSWLEPDKADPLRNDVIDLTIEGATEPTEETTTKPVESVPEPTDETTKPTEGESEPTKETTKNTEDESEPTKETTKPTEGESEPTKETTKPVEDETEPTEESTKPENVVPELHDGPT